MNDALRHAVKSWKHISELAENNKKVREILEQLQRVGLVILRDLLK